MAPELLEGNVEASTKTDMYSLGVLFNELCVEEDPYSEHYRKFLGKGPYAATLFAKEGNRPRQTSQGNKGAQVCNSLIQRCWHADPAQRPTAAALRDSVLAENCVLPSLAAAAAVHAVSKGGSVE
jgi:serine/threonine protein kinase